MMTVKQKQNLLQYLGYYTGAIDGSWGAKSIQATKEFQEDSGLDVDGVFGDKTEEVIVTAVFHGKFADSVTAEESTNAGGDWWSEIKYFNRSEFRCKCGKCGGFPVEPNEKLVKAADKVRIHFGVPVNLSSGVRCKTHNAKVGGVSDSRHLKGKAMDFVVSGQSAKTTLAYVKTLPEIRYAYAIDGSYVHMDVN